MNFQRSVASVFRIGEELDWKGVTQVSAASLRLPTTRFSGAQAAPQQSLNLRSTPLLLGWALVLTQAVVVEVVGYADELPQAYDLAHDWFPVQVQQACLRVSHIRYPVQWLNR